MASIQAQRVPRTARLSYAKRVAALTRGVDNVLIDHVRDHEDAWEKYSSAIARTPPSNGYQPTLPWAVGTRWSEHGGGCRERGTKARGAA